MIMKHLAHTLPIGAQEVLVFLLTDRGLKNPGDLY